jgi:hypothetical protein
MMPVWSRHKNSEPTGKVEWRILNCRHAALSGLNLDDGAAVKPVGASRSDGGRGFQPADSFRLSQFLQRFDLNLADALTRQREVSGDFLQ